MIAVCAAEIMAESVVAVLEICVNMAGIAVSRLDGRSVIVNDHEY